VNARIPAFAVFLTSLHAGAQPIPPIAIDPQLIPSAANTALPLQIHGDAIYLTAGFSGVAGSFAELSWKTRNLFHFGETTSLAVEAGVRLAEIQWGLTRHTVFGTRWKLGVTASLRRFHYNQEKESSLTAFDRDIRQYRGFQLLDDTIDYTSTGYGSTGFAQYPFHGGLSHFGLVYGYDVSAQHPITAASLEYFSEFAAYHNRFSGIRTSWIMPSYTWNTVDNPAIPTRGTFFTTRATFAGLGGGVNLIEPAIEARHYRAGLRKRDVIAFSARARLIHGYSGQSAPPFDRYYMGGEDEVRGLNSWSASPIAFVPSTSSINVLNPDGSQRFQPVIVNNTLTFAPVTQTIPIYRPVALGGDAKVLANAEYRAALKGPFTLVFFADMGLNRIVFADQLRLNQGFVDLLNQNFPSSSFRNRLGIAPGLQRARMSIGAELRVRLPKIGEPIRFFWAWNPRVYNQSIPVPLPFDRSLFPNQATFINAMQIYGAPLRFQEPRNSLRFSVGRTF